MEVRDPVDPSEPSDELGSQRSASEQKPESLWRRKTREVQRSFYYRFPELSFLQDAESRKADLAEDARENLETAVAVDEQLRLRAIWGVEIYGPGEMNGLYSAIRKLGWDTNESWQKSPTLSTWISEQRMYGEQALFNLGPIQRKGETRFLGGSRRAPIPESVDYIVGSVIQVTPSTTAVILCFVLAAGIATTFEGQLNADRRQARRRIGFKRAYEILQVEHVKLEAVESKRTELRSSAVEWFGQNIPGYFSRRRNSHKLPTAELLTTTRNPIFPTSEEAGRILPRWREILTGHGYHDIWRLKDKPGLALSWNRAHAIVTVETENIEGYRRIETADPESWMSIQYARDHVEGILIQFAVIALLIEETSELRQVRETMSLAVSSQRDPMHTIRRIREHFDRSLGLPMMTAELQERSRKRGIYRWDCSEFERERFGKDKVQKVDLIDTIMGRTDHLATKALAQERETREHLEQMSAILSVQESIKAQGKMERLTVVALALAAASLFTALLSVNSVERAFNDALDQFVLGVPTHAQRLNSPR